MALSSVVAPGPSAAALRDACVRTFSAVFCSATGPAQVAGGRQIGRASFSCGLQRRRRYERRRDRPVAGALRGRRDSSLKRDLLAVAVRYHVLRRLVGRAVRPERPSIETSAPAAAQAAQQLASEGRKSPVECRTLHSPTSFRHGRAHPAYKAGGFGTGSTTDPWRDRGRRRGGAGAALRRQRLGVKRKTAPAARLSATAPSAVSGGRSAQSPSAPRGRAGG